MHINKIIKIIIFLFLFLFASSILLHEIGNDSDIWLHLKTGQYILQNHQIPSQDIFSYTAEGNKWINHEWLYQITVYSIFNLLGPNGIILFRGLVFLLICLAIYQISRFRGNYLLTAAGIFLFLMVIKDRLNDRPEMLTLLFTAVFILIFERYIKTKLIWTIPLIQLLWANTHGYFIMGIIIVSAYAIQEFFNKERRIKRVAGIWGLSIAASFLNPSGISGFLYPFRMLAGIRGESKIFTHYINELVSPFVISGQFLSGHIFFYKLIAVIAVCALALNIKRIKPANLIIFCIALAMSLFAIRNIPLFALIGTWTILAHINGFYSFHKANKSLPAVSEKITGYLQPFTALLLIAVFGVLFVQEATSEYYVFDTSSYKSSLFGVSEIKYPAKAVNFLKDEGVKGNILNNFFCGSYLIWRLYPEKKVFIDGRTEVYGPQFYKYYRNALDDERLFRDLLYKYKINAILFFDPAGGPQQSFIWLLKSPEWKIVYFDDLSMIFVKDSEENVGVINKYGIDLRDIQTLPFDKASFRKKEIYSYRYINRGKVFAFAGLFDKAESEAKVALSINQKDAQAYNLLGAIYLSRGDFNLAIEILEKAIVAGQSDENLHYNLGIAYSGINKLTHAEREYEEALRINPLSQRATFALALCYEKNGKVGMAEGVLSRMANKDLTGDINCELGYVYLKEKKMESAKTFFENALRINSNHARTHNGIGLVYAYNNAPMEAEMHFKSAIDNAPNFKEAYDNLGVVYAKNQDYEKAILQWEKALQIDPDFGPAREKLERTRKFLNEQNLK